MKFRIAIALTTLLICLAIPTTAQDPSDLPTLTLGKVVEQQLSGGDSHKYRVNLKAGDFVHVVIEQKGTDVVVSLIGPDGKKLVEADSPNGSQVSEPLAEYSYEASQWNNGVFTYAVLDGLKTGKADGNNDGVITVAELRVFVTATVSGLTGGKQTPTARRENLETDFRVF